VCRGDQIRFRINTLPNLFSKSTLFQSRKSTSCGQRNQVFVRQKCHSAISLDRGFFHQQYFSGTKKGRGSETCNQFEKAKCFFEVRTFQNGRDSFVKDLLLKDDWMVKIDLTDAYLTLK